MKNKISKKGNSEFDNFKKQCWIYILSLLDLDELMIIAQVCKTFYFILEENDRFWKIFVEKNYGSIKITSEYQTWKSLYFSFIRFRWNEKRLNPFFTLDLDETLVSLKPHELTYNWLCCITENYFLENFLYPFHIHFKGDQLRFTIGVCSEETDLDSDCIFGCDEYRYGYYSDQNDVYISNNSSGKEESLLHFEDKSKLMILVHQGSYSKENATVSFFIQKDKGEIEYQITLINVPISKNGKLHGFFGSYNSLANIQLCSPIPFDPKHFENVNVVRIMLKN